MFEPSSAHSFYRLHHLSFSIYHSVYTLRVCGGKLGTYQFFLKAMVRGMDGWPNTVLHGLADMEKTIDCLSGKNN